MERKEMGSFKRPQLRRLERDEAETIALQCITFLAEDPSRISRFMAITGIDVQELSKNIEKVAILAAALDYLMKEESLLLMFASNFGVSVHKLPAARAALEDIAVQEIKE